MINILVADSVENELNHLILLLEDYKAHHYEFDKILNILDTNDEQEAMEVIQQKDIDILFVSNDMEKVAFSAYKKDRETLIISVSDKPQRIRKWCIDHLIKPLSQELINLRVRSYLDIVISRKVGIKDYHKKVIYDLSIVPNLQLFWRDYFTTSSNLNGVIHLIYSLGLKQIDRGVASTIEIIEEDKNFTFKFLTQLDKEIMDYLTSLKRDVEFQQKEDGLLFEVSLDEEDIINEKAGELEDLALEYLSYDKLEILNDFLAQSEIAESEEKLEEFKEKITKSEKLQEDEIDSYIDHKRNLGQKRYTFLDRLDMKIFSSIVDALRKILEGEKERITIDEVAKIEDYISNLSKILGIYQSAKEVVIRLGKLEELLLKNGKKIEDSGKSGVEAIGLLVTTLENWRDKLSNRKESSEDFIDSELVDNLEAVATKLLN